jgi:type VI secretion system protein ImpM
MTDWLQSAFAASKKQLGEGWLEAYLTSPIYRFVLSPGLCGEECRIGIMMPSVDWVGRYYPFILGAGLDEPGNPFHLLQRHNRWFEQAQALALSALEDDFELDALVHSVAALDTLINQAHIASNAILCAAEGDARGDCLLIRETLNSPTGLDALYPTLLHNTLREVCHAYSLWWTAGSEKVAPSILISQGLPPADSVAALLVGDWDQRGWLDNQSQLHLIIAEDEDSDEPWAS